MDCKKTGRLILQLRREKGLTQQEIADALHISNKTVSKWECGLGWPDISLLPELSRILETDIQKVLEGSLDPNRLDTGNLILIRFYVCPECGNILTSTGPADLTCCGRRLSPLKPVFPTKEHEVRIEEADLDYYITLEHEMSKAHYIAFIAYVNNDKIYLVRMYPEQGAEVRIPAMPRSGSLYIYCNRHGLMVYPDIA